MAAWYCAKSAEQRNLCHRMRPVSTDDCCMSTSPARTLPLSVPRASALYIGALFGPGLLLLPGLAAQQAGPASIIVRRARP
jgi:amino acid permease